MHLFQIVVTRFPMVGKPASDGDVGCNMACSGNTSETCGGPNRLDLYNFGATSTCAPISTVTVTTTVTSTGSSTTTTTDPCTTPDPAVSIVHNGGFECGIAPWQQQLVSVATAGLTSPGHSSQFAYAVDQTGTPDISGNVPVPAISQNLTSVSGKTYTISFDTYITGSFAGFVGVKINGKPYWTVDSNDNLGPGVWNTNSFAHTADSASLTLTFEFLAGYIWRPFCNRQCLGGVMISCSTGVHLLRTPASRAQTHVLAVRPWHTGCLLYLVALLPLPLFFRFVVLL
jgi:hypothetical protein